MTMNDPLGDMLTRIRNAADARSKSKVSTPGLEAARARPRRAAGRRLHPRLLRRSSTDGQPEFEIELKYFDGEPVIREIERVSKPGRRVYASVKDLPRVSNGLGISILSTPKGVMSDAEARDAERRRRSPLHGVLRRGNGNGMSRIGKKPVAVPKGVTASVDGQTVAVKGPKGELCLRRDRRHRRRRSRTARSR